VTFTIILLAMVALFIGLRLYSVLGKRTGHEQPIAKPAEIQPRVATTPRHSYDPAGDSVEPGDAAVTPGALDGARAIAAVDPSFDPSGFLGGAKAAYRMVLEAYWRGDVEELRRLADDSVVAAFAEAIDMRKEAGHVLDNRLVTIERALIERARIEGANAIVTVRFDADIAAVTRDGEGNVVAGSTTDAVQTHDIWTFGRQIRANDPNWTLIETDEAA